MPDFEPLPDSSPLLTGALRPEAMAIGDSIFNGVRSATIDRTLAQWSPPAQAARALGLPMVLPDYRRPLLFDLEAEVRAGINLGGIRRNVVDNIDRWMEERGEWSGRRFFDNIGIAGATYGDLHNATAGAARERIPALVAAVKRAPTLDFDAVARLWFNLNTAYLLNPGGDPELEDLTPLEQVASRKPRRLFVNIGSNEGLFRIGITGNYSRANRRSIAVIPTLAQELAQALDSHCGDVERIYFNLLIRPRTIANLAPLDDAEMFRSPGDGYFESYVGRLGSLNGMSADQMQRFDREIAEINDRTTQAMRGVLGDRIVFVDTYDVSTRFDGKHYGNDRKVTVDAGGRPFRLSNMPLSANVFGFRQGGLFGLDNMHPTAVGYAVIAAAMVEAVATAEGTAPLPVDPQAAFDADTLLQDPPRSWDRLNLLFSLIAGLSLVPMD